MRTLKLSLAYCGTRYSGYQVQKNAPTIAGVFQTALWEVLGEQVDLKGCSRTDAGVHANAFVLSFATNSQIPCYGLVRGLLVKLPPDISVLSAEEVPEDFHARYSATGKRYVYLVRNTFVKDPFGHKLALLHPQPLDEALLNRAAKAFLGTYDFSAFCSVGSSVQDHVRTLYAFDVTRVGQEVRFTVVGDGFLYNMVRILVGTLLEVAAGRIAPEALPQIITGKNRTAAGPTVPPWGLYLDKVYYTPLPNALQEEERP